MRFHAIKMDFSKSLLLVISLSLSFALTACDSPNKANIVKKPNNGNGGTGSQKPEVKIATGDTAAITFLVSSWGDQFLRKALGQTNSEKTEQCVRLQDDKKGTETYTLTGNCNFSKVEIFGGLKVVTTKNSEIVQKVVITTFGSQDASPLTFTTRADDYIVNTKIVAKIELTRQSATNFSFKDEVTLMSERLPKKSGGAGNITANVDVNRTGVIQVSAGNNPNIIAYDTNDSEIDMRSDHATKDKAFNTVLQFDHDKSKSTGHILKCGLPQGQLMFKNVTDFNGEKIEREGTVHITNNELVDQLAGRKHKIKGVCEGLIMFRLDEMRRLLGQRMDSKFGSLGTENERGPRGNPRKGKNEPSPAAAPLKGALKNSTEPTKESEDALPEA